MLVKMQLCWEGHITRIEDRCLPKILLYGDLSYGRCDVGGDGKQIQGFFQELHPHLQHQPLKKSNAGLTLEKRGKDGTTQPPKKQAFTCRVQKLFNIVYLN